MTAEDKAKNAGKVALVLEGGSFRGQFTAGVLDVLMEAGVEIPAVYGVSAGALNGVNYKSHQIGRVIRYNTEYCNDKRYASFRNLLRTGNLYSEDFCYHEVPEKLDPFDEEAFRASPMDFFVVCTDLHKAIVACDIIAPEHLEVCVEDPFGVLNEIKNAGSIFLGRNVPEALGDYFAGPNHTLPTSGTARFSSPLGVDDFVKKSSFLYYTREALGEVAPRIADFAEREGLHAHAKSVTIRYKED